MADQQDIPAGDSEIEIYQRLCLEHRFALGAQPGKHGRIPRAQKQNPAVGPGYTGFLHAADAQRPPRELVAGFRIQTLSAPVVVSRHPHL
ncbi:MAG: hypothetical protein GX634_11760 [Lentisphaerae bacterium]|nr:hypothetical protein [Lentisphaerota bacterium]